MARNVYEGLFIFDPDAFNKAPEEVSNQITTTVEQADGEVLLSRIWEERKLAYPIEGHRRGTYWLVYFAADSLKVKELSRQLRLNNNIVRFLLVKLDPRLVDVIVEHARTGQFSSTEHLPVEQIITEDVFEDEESPEEIAKNEF
ncbi:MAG: 30S ribosomal protein S6 [Planctomycetaceae bacterium]|nr:30S ribosomal protein S6 [Planctomycetaceae bacterium]